MFFINFFHMGAIFCFFPTIKCHPRIPTRIFIVFDEHINILKSVLLPIQAPAELPRTAFPTGGLQVGDRTDFVQEVPMDLQCLTMISAILCRGRRIQNAGHSDLGISAISERLPILLVCKRILHPLLVLRNLEASQRHPLLSRPSHVTQTSLAL